MPINEMPLIEPPMGSQRALFEAVLAQLSRLDFRPGLIARDYGYRDSFLATDPLRVAPAVAFAEEPFSYTSACISVLLSNDKSGADLVNEHRALGAPIAIEVLPTHVCLWRVTPHTTSADLRFRFDSIEHLARAVDEHTSDWSRNSIARAKRIGPVSTAGQLDFVDLGLLPALEFHIQQRLDPVLLNTLSAAQDRYRAKHGRPVDARALFRVTFWMLAAKALHDRSVTGFQQFSSASDPKAVLKRVGEHYSEAPPTFDVDVLRIVHERFWSALNFQNLSVDVLAYVYENTLVDKKLRKARGIHATPPSVARYVLNRMPFESVSKDERFTVEPFSGSASFLVAAIQRLRSLLPAASSGSDRHKHFVRMLSGFELDSFALEVSRLCLTLADLPNPNGWRLFEGDVFEKRPELIRELNRARFVAANPPFEKLSDEERRKYKEWSVPPLRAVGLLDLILSHTHQDCSFGLVLPSQFVDGNSYRESRDRLTKRFREIEIVKLPEKVFANAEHESVILIASAPASGTSTTFHFARIRSTGWSRWQVSEQPLQFVSARMSAAEAVLSVNIASHRKVWAALNSHETLGAIAKSHRGIEWNLDVEENEESLVSPTRRAGFKEGLRNSKGLCTLELPSETVFLQMAPELAKGNAYRLPWDKPKVFTNAIRKTRGPWRLVAAADRDGLVATQAFTVLWPTSAKWDVDLIAAVLSGPVANAFLFDHEDGRHITTEVLKRVPFPRRELLNASTLKALISRYQAHSAAQRFDEAEVLLRRIDAQVLTAYELTPLQERAVLNGFAGAERPVPNGFGDYYPPGFPAAIPLSMFDSPEFHASSARQLLQAPMVEDPALDEVLADLVD